MGGWLWHRRGKSQERGILVIGFGWGSIEQTASLSSKSSAASKQIVTPTPNLEQGIHGVPLPPVSSLAALSFSTATEAFGQFWLRSSSPCKVNCCQVQCGLIGFGMLVTSLCPRLAIQRISFAALTPRATAALKLPSRPTSAIKLGSTAVMRAPTGVGLPSLYDGNNRQQQLGPRGSESFFVNKQGLKIATYFWPSEAATNTKAVVIAVHGHGAHSQNEWLRRQVSSASIHTNASASILHALLLIRDPASRRSIADPGFRHSTRQGFQYAVLTSKGWDSLKVHATSDALLKHSTTMFVTCCN